MKRIRLMAAKLLRKENADPAESLLLYTNKRPSRDKILQVKVTMARSKVRSRSHHDVAHLHPLTNVPTKYQLPTPYSFRNIAQTIFYRSRSLRQGSKVKPRSHYDITHLKPLTNVPTTYQLPTPYGGRDI